jgi:hypothetical protein
MRDPEAFGEVLHFWKVMQAVSSIVWLALVLPSQRDARVSGVDAIPFYHMLQGGTL